MSDFIQGINWSPLWISLKTGAVATAIAFFLGMVRQKNNENEACFQGGPGRHSDYAPGAASYGGRLFSAGNIQPQKTFWKIFAGGL